MKYGKKFTGLGSLSTEQLLRGTAGTGARILRNKEEKGLRGL